MDAVCPFVPVLHGRVVADGAVDEGELVALMHQDDDRGWGKHEVAVVLSEQFDCRASDPKNVWIGDLRAA